MKLFKRGTEMKKTVTPEPGGRTAKFLGSLRDALAAASKEETAKTVTAPATVRIQPDQAERSDNPTQAVGETPAKPREAVRAADAARTARGGTPNVPPLRDRHVEFEAPPTTRVVRSPPARTQLLRGKQKIERGELEQDPVVGWVVVVGGPGLGCYRPIYEGNNALGRSSDQRIPIDFGDDAISTEEQAYIRYDSQDRSFLFVPNLTKPNVVSVNNKRPTTAVVLSAMDVITVGRTQLAFVPFCGADFDWAEITDANA
jgi:hypothetical protein